MIKPATGDVGFARRMASRPSPCLFPCLLLPLVLIPLLARAQPLYTADTTWFKNPERGLFEFVTSHRTAADSTGQGFWRFIAAEPDSISLVFEEFVLHDFKASDISPAYLDMMRAEFANVRKYGMKAIVIFCYVTSSDWDQTSPPDTVGATIDWMLTHIREVQPVIRENGDVIAFVQAGFIGRWGEWGGGAGTISVAHPDYSRDTAAQARLLTGLLAMLPADRMLDVRAPRYKIWYLHDATPMSLADWWSGSPRGRIGQHNNALHASATNSGTFYDYNVHDTAFFRAWYKTETKFGGSVAEQDELWNSPYDPSWFADLNGWFYSFVQPLGRESAEMANQHVASVQLLDQPWSQGMKARGLWNIVRRNLGYRFQLQSAALPSSVAPGGLLRLRLTLINTGWSSPRNPRGLELILRDDSTGADIAFPLFRHKHPSLDPRLWWPGDTIRIDTSFALAALSRPGTYRAFLNLPDTSARLAGRPEYSIRLANRGVWEPRTGYNNLGAAIAVSGSAQTVSAAPSIPLQFELEQNYPNPFNPSTTIRYTVPFAAHVTLTVYNTLGQKVALLVDHTAASGRYEARFDGSTRASGVYYVRLTATPAPDLAPGGPPEGKARTRTAVRPMVLAR